MAKNQNYTDVLLEDMNSKFDTILEIVIPMRKELSEVKRIVEDIPEIKADLKTMELALAQTNVQVSNYETRITKLEAKTA